VFTLGFLVFIYSHIWTHLHDDSSLVHEVCEWVNDEFQFEVDYSDFSLLLFYIFRLLLIILERWYDMYWCNQFSKNWTIGRGVDAVKDIDGNLTIGREFSGTNNIQWKHELEKPYNSK